MTAATVSTVESAVSLPTVRSARRPGRLAVRAPWTLVAVPVLFNLWALRGELLPVQLPNDGALHLSMVQWARGRIAAGQIPLDGWFPYLGIGSANFHHYQVLPHIITAYLSVLFGTATTFAWSTYVLLAFWPVSVYLGMRLLDWSPWESGAAALMAPLLASASGFGFEPSSYLFRGWGLWPQLWGMCLMPVALGLGWRAIEGRGRLVLAALAAGLTITCHLIAGYLVLLALGLFAVSRGGRAVLWRMVRTALVGAGALLVAAWLLVPFITEVRWTPASTWANGTFYVDSFGAARILRWLVTGQLYDAGRFPIVSLFVGVGLAVCLVRLRRDARARAVVLFWLASLVLFFGPRDLGPIMTIVPFLNQLPLHRMIMGVHLSGLILAGIGLAWLGAVLVGLGRRFLPEVQVPIQVAVAMVLGVLVLGPAWKSVADYDLGSGDLVRSQAAFEQTDGAGLIALADQIKLLPPGRVYAGSRATWGNQYAVGSVAAYSMLENLNLDVVGYTLRVTSLMTEPEAYFDESNPAQYDMFNIRYLVLPNDRRPPVNATLVARQGRHTLWRVITSGYLEVVDTVGPPIATNPSNIGNQTAGFLESPDLGGLRYHWVSYDGATAPNPTLPTGAAPTEPAGFVLRETDTPADGSFSGQIVANHLAVVLLKTSYEPRWKVDVDGVGVQPEMIAPALIGVPVVAGAHTVSFHYLPYPYSLPLIGLAILALLGLWALPEFGVTPGGRGQPARRSTKR